jgi:hypothetical protein
VAVLTDGPAWPWWNPGFGRAGGQMPLGLVRGGRIFEVSSDGDAGTVLHVREEYTGPLQGLVWRPVPDLGPSLGRFAQGVRRRAETGR